MPAHVAGMTSAFVGGVRFSKVIHSINPLETILGHQWALPLPFGDAHARP